MNLRRHYAKYNQCSELTLELLIKRGDRVAAVSLVASPWSLGLTHKATVMIRQSRVPAVEDSSCSSSYASSSSCLTP